MRVQTETKTFLLCGCVFSSRPKLDWRFLQRFCRILKIPFQSWNNQSVRMFLTLLGVALSVIKGVI
uniref:Uncharacterized protein n=1 Tax=Sinocyclocheilus grahami TaxID=75366 RepID=A0A672S006_SINGR